MLQKTPNSVLHIGNHTIPLTETATHTGAMFDSTLSMNTYVAYICKGAWHHLRQIGQIRQYLDPSSIAKLRHSFVSATLGNVDSLVFGVPSFTSTKLQCAACSSLCVLKDHNN